MDENKLTYTEEDSEQIWPKKPIPVLDRCIPSTADNGDDDYEDFLYLLAEWASNWVPEVSLPIMRRARELYHSVAVDILLERWKREQKLSHGMLVDELVRVARDPEASLEDAKEGLDLYPRETHGLNMALYELLV